MWLHRLQRSIVRVVDAPPPWPGSSLGASGAGCSSWQWWVTQCWKKDTGDSNLEKIVLILTPQKIGNPCAHYILHKKPKLFKWIVYLKIDKGFHFSNNTIKWWNVSKNSDLKLKLEWESHFMCCYLAEHSPQKSPWGFDDSTTEIFPWNSNWKIKFAKNSFPLFLPKVCTKKD